VEKDKPSYLSIESHLRPCTARTVSVRYWAVLLPGWKAFKGGWPALSVMVVIWYGYMQSTSTTTSKMAPFVIPSVVLLSLFLSSAAAAAVLPGPDLDSRDGGPGGSSCKSIPGDPRWPAAPEWERLNRTIGGRLIAAKPAASVCHVDPFHVYDAAACANLQTNWDRPETQQVYPPVFLFQHKHHD